MQISKLNQSLVNSHQVSIHFLLSWRHNTASLSKPVHINRIRQNIARLRQISHSDSKIPVFVIHTRQKAQVIVQKELPTQDIALAGSFQIPRKHIFPSGPCRHGREILSRLPSGSLIMMKQTSSNHIHSITSSYHINNSAYSFGKKPIITIHEPHVFAFGKV